VGGDPQKKDGEQDVFDGVKEGPTRSPKQKKKSKGEENVKKPSVVNRSENVKGGQEKGRQAIGH